MRVLHVIASVARAGGGPVAVVSALTPPLRALGCETEVVSLDDPGRVETDVVDAPVHPLGRGGDGYRYSKEIVPWLRANAQRFDATVVHGIWTYHSLATWRAFNSGEQPYFVFPHGMLDPWFRRSYPRKHLKKLIYWLVSERKVLRDARSVLFTCEQERVLASKTFPGYQCRETVVNFGTAASVGEPVVEEEAFLRLHPHLRQRRFLLFLGRLHPKKGLDLLIRAYAKVVVQLRATGRSCSDLVIAGPPDTDAYFAELRRLCAEVSLPIMDAGSAGTIPPRGSVTFCPMLTGPEKWGALRASEAFVLPSHQENFGIAVAEAMSCARPVLISDQVNIWREIQSDGAGLVEADTVDGTMRLLSRWESLLPVERAQMGHHALACFNQRFEIRRAAESLLSAVRYGLPHRAER